MQIAHLNFPSQLIQAPLAGYSCAPLRKLAWQWGKPAYCCTEMLSSKHLYSGAAQRKRYIYKDPAEGPLAFQLASDAPDNLQYACEQVEQFGADLIDLNCGCPQPKIRKKNCGSRLLEQPTLISCLVSTMKRSTQLPITVKIRLPTLINRDYNRELMQRLMDAGADAIIVHGRHWQEDYSQACHIDHIADLVQAVSIPVIANGDVSDAVSAKKILKQTGCAGLMIARASVGQPWLFQQIASELIGKSFTKPTLNDIGGMFIQHVRELITLDNEKLAILQARGLGKYYARQNLGPKFLEKLHKLDNFVSFTQLIKQYFMAGLSVS